MFSRIRHAPSSRRKFIRRLLLGGAGLLAGRVTLSLFRERYWLRVRRIRVPLPSLPAALDGFTICQLSDIHRGRLVSEEYVRRGAELAMSLRPDLIAVTGDFVTARSSYAASCAAALSLLRAPYGVYGVMGNHERWTADPDAIIAALEDVGVRMLVNRSVPVNVRGAYWWLCGVDTVWSGNPDLDVALREVPAGAFRILLCHEPDFADRAAKRNIPLQLSGHSHGGQIVLPLLGPPVLPLHGRKYPRGLQTVKGSATLVYTNVGLGLISPAIRLNCRPEVTLLTLRKAS